MWVHPQDADADFFTFRAKPGLCYLVQTGELSSGLDTTVLLWQAVLTKDKWKLVGQNDDAHPGAPDLSSAVRWCSLADATAVIEVRNYGGGVVTDPHGKTYNLSLMIDPPMPSRLCTAHNDTPAATYSARSGGTCTAGSRRLFCATGTSDGTSCTAYCNRHDNPVTDRSTAYCYAHPRLVGSHAERER